MTSISINRQSDTKQVLWSLGTVISITTFLFFIDEGNYNFQWASNPFYWIAFAIYAIGLLIGHLIINLLVLRKYKGKNKALLTCVLGTILGLIVTIGFFMFK